MEQNPHTLFNLVKEQIKEQYYVPLPFSLSYSELSDAAEHFFNFLKLPIETKKAFYHEIDPHDEESVIGYVRRCKDGTCDEKEYFHYNRYAPDVFKELRKKDDIVVSNFFDAAEKIYEEAEKHADIFLRGADEDFPGTYKRFFPENKKPHFYLRFLKYDVMGKGKFLADGHYDQGALTFALAESAPGLRIGSDNTDLQEVEHRDGQLLCMPGLQLKDILSNDFSPAWHDVVQSSDNTYSDQAARWAIVFFIDPIEKNQTNWKDRHTVKTSN